MITRLVAMLCLVAFSVQGAGTPFTVSQVKWSRSVQKKGKEIEIDSVKAEVNRDDLLELHLRFIIVGNEETLKYLEMHNTLPVFVEWHLDGAVVNEPAPWLGISIDHWEEHEDAWRQEVKERGSFAFRTHAKRTYIKPGRYSIIIRDRNHQPIGPHGAPIPYQPSITVTPPTPQTRQ